MHACMLSVAHCCLGRCKCASCPMQVRMHVFGNCKMGISFWPSFGFKAPDREEEVGGLLRSSVHEATDMSAPWHLLATPRCAPRPAQHLLLLAAELLCLSLCCSQGQ